MNYTPEGIQQACNEYTDQQYYLSQEREAAYAQGRKDEAETHTWQPIETAPKYTPIRLYAQGGGFYDEDFNPSGSIEGFWGDDTGWCGAFWNAEQDDWDRRDGIVPTHWMPLPKAPEAGIKEGS